MKPKLEGWPAALALLAFTLFNGLGVSFTVRFLGDLGSFLFVTFHFVLIPFSAIVLAGFTIRSLFRSDSASDKIFRASSLLVLAFIIYVTFFNSIFLLEVSDKLIPQANASRHQSASPAI